MATYAPGVIFTPESAGYVRPFDTSSPSTMSIDGTRSGSNQFMMDGAPNMQGTQVAYSPPPGVVEEFKVQSASFDAASGFMGGASINMSLKSGTNSVHGQVYYFMQNPVFTADKYFRLAVGKPQFRLYRWGGSVSGPGRHSEAVQRPQQDILHVRLRGHLELRSFALGGGSRADRGDARTAISPVCWRSESNYQIYDPYLDPADRQRALSAASRCPTTSFRRTDQSDRRRRSPLSGTCRTRPGTVDGINNYQKGKNAQDTYWNHIVRIDHNVSDKQRLYVRTNFTDLQRPGKRPPQQCGRRQLLPLQQRLRDRPRLHRFAADLPERPLHADAVHHRLSRRFSTAWDLAGLGFSSNFINQINGVDPRALKLPNISVSGYSSLGGVNTRNNTATDIHEAAHQRDHRSSARTPCGTASRSAPTGATSSISETRPADQLRYHLDTGSAQHLGLGRRSARVSRRCSTGFPEAAASRSAIPTRTSPMFRRCSSRTTGSSAAS